MRNSTKNLELDKKIGAKINQLRLAKGLTHEKFAKAMGVSRQQLRKYLTGDNRLSASFLPTVLQLVNISIADFFEDIETYEIVDSEQARLGMELAREYAKLSTSQARYAVLHITKALNKGNA